MTSLKCLKMSKDRDYVIKVRTGAIWSSKKRPDGYNDPHSPRQWRKDRLGTDHNERSMPLGYTTFQFVPTTPRNIRRFQPLENVA